MYFHYLTINVVNDGLLDVENFAMKICRFVPETYWEIQADFKSDAAEYKARWVKLKNLEKPEHPKTAQYRIWKKSQAEDIIKRCKGKEAKCVADHDLTLWSCSISAINPS